MRLSPALAFLVLLAAPASAQDVRLDIQSGASSRLPIRCLPLAPAGDRDARSSSVQADEVLAADLQNSAVFAVAKAWDPGVLAPPPPQAEVGGKWTVNGSTVRLAGEVTDATSRKAIFAKEYRAPLARWREAVHRFADDVVMQFTGEPGVASTRIAFVVQDGRAKELWVMDADGHGARPVTSDGSLVQSPAWSPEGSLVLFTSYRGGGPQVWVASPEQRKPFLVSGRPGLNTSAAYSPDGREIACTLSKDGNAEIYRLDARGGSPQRLTDSRGIDTAPAWSPTGRDIAFTSDRSGQPQVHVMDASGGNVRRLTYDVSYTDSPAWSPKGDRIAFVTRAGNGFDIWICRPDGSGAMRVVSGGSNENPRWSPDGRHLVFASNRDGTRSLWVSDLDGAAPRKLDTGGRKAMSPAWSPRLAGEVRP